MNLQIWSPTIGDQVLTPALLAAILGATSGNISTSITTAGNGTLTAAGIVGGQITRTGPSANYTDTTDTAAAIVAATGAPFQSGQRISVAIKNATAFVQTVSAGAGVTFSAASKIPPFSIARYTATVGGTAASPTVTFAHVNTDAIAASAEASAPQTAALTTVGAGTITAAMINSGIVLRGGAQAGSAFTDTTDIATNIVAGVSAVLTIDGTSCYFTYVNNTNAPATISGGTGVTVSGVTVVPPNSWARYVLTRTSATAVTLVGVGQGFFSANGTVTANGATPVVVNNAAVTAFSQITLTYKSGTQAATTSAWVGAKVAGTSFSLKSVAGDTAVYDYEIRG